MEIDKEYLKLQTLYHKMYDDEENLFPNEWYNVKEYDLKKKILLECLENHIKIKDSQFYYDFKMKALNGGNYGRVKSITD